MNNTIIKASNLSKSFWNTEHELKILDNINFSINEKQSVSIIGSSGSGKSTLLHILAGLDNSTQGSVFFENQALDSLDDISVSKIRNKYIGFIYQFHHLLGEFSALENTLMPIMINNKVSASDIDYAKFLLAELGLSSRISHLPSQLSGGERQRVAIARALINHPKIILADEPTGNLDNLSANSVLDKLFQLQEKVNTSLIIVTHDLAIAQKTQIQYRLQNAKLELLV